MVVLALIAISLHTDLDKILETPLLKGAAASVYVCKLDGSVLYERNARQRLIPASNQKLFSAAFALNSLGPTYHPTTNFWKLKDRIVVETSGDPLMSYADLSHVREVLGLTGRLPVYVKQPYRIGFLPDWELDDLPNKYAAPVTAFTVDRSSFEIWEDKDGPFFEPTSYGTKVVRRRSTRRHVKYDPFTRTAVVYGAMPETPGLLDTLSLPDPDKAAASILGSGYFEASATPAGPSDFTLEGQALGEILQECLVNSDNNIAENLLLLSALAKGPLGENPYETSVNREKEFLTRAVGTDPDEFKPDDGSGLSRSNYTTTHCIASLLVWESAQPTFPLWMDALASPGFGTLRDRLAGSSFRGKTGTMDGVVALSGYLKTKDAQEIVVSMIFNNHASSSNEIRGLEDRFVRKLEESTLSGTVLEGRDNSESHTAHSSLGRVPFHWFS